jgi:hypothetical protein
MNTPIQSFVIRIWLEEISEGSGESVWRGHITHVETKKRIHFTRPEQIAEIVASYMDEMGVDTTSRLSLTDKNQSD